MTQTLLTPSVITKESLAVLHQECRFIKNIDRQYDSQYAKSGAKIGANLKVRMPNEFTVRTGQTIDVQDVQERSETITMATQKGVDMSFSSQELTLTIDEFSDRYIKPAMSVLAADIENTVISALYKDVYNFYDGVDAANTFANLQNANKILTDGLSPSSERCMLHDTQSTVDVIADTKGLFHAGGAISEQYKEGQIGSQVAGMDHFESTIMPIHTTGTAVEGDTGYNINNASGESASDSEVEANVQTVTVDTGSTTLLQGDIITIAGVFRVHPETKVSTGELQKFVLTADSGANATSLTISPPIITSGGRQNVNAAAADDAAINKVGGGASSDWKQCLAFHKKAFAFVSADLEDVSEYGAWSAREVMDGISMRIARQFDITNDTVPARIDVLFGYKTLRAQNAMRLGFR